MTVQRLTLQAGLDFSIGNGWSLNADVKKTFIDTEIILNGTGIAADADLAPWIFSAGLGYRFNLFGHSAQAAPIKVNDKYRAGAGHAPPDPFCRSALADA